MNLKEDIIKLDKMAKALPKIHTKLLSLPMHVFMGWCKYKGEVFFAMVNYEKSIACNRPIIDLCYCATKALNNNVLKSVNYNQTHFESYTPK